MAEHIRSKRGWLKGLNPTVALVSKAIVVVFVLFGVLMTETAGTVFEGVSKSIISTVSWFYIGLVAVSLGVVIWLMLSRFGNMRLGAEGEEPEFGYFAWFAMLFAAGMGIGLVFWSVAEPIFHFQSNPFIEEGEAQTAVAAETALRLTFFHWGLHPWAIYALVALCFAYFGFRRGLPLTIRSALYPLIGDRIYGRIGHAVDILAIFATTFGVATSLGFGAAQINTGLNQLFGLEISVAHQIIIIGAVTLVAVISVASGLDRGIKLLSEGNFWLSIILLTAVASLGPTAYIIESFLQGIGDYLQNVVYLSFWTDAEENRGWQAAWTTFYWGWWISWAPFVGMFIARISRGRTIREFLVGVLIVPTLVTFLWLTVMGATALHMELFGDGGIVEATNEETTLALYATLSKLTGGALWMGLATIATILVATYFITSADSGTLVINTILSVGNENPPLFHRVLWGLSQGVVAGVLLLAGGLQALQAAAISAALPFAVIMVFMIVGLIRALYEEHPPEVHDVADEHIEGRE